MRWIAAVSAFMMFIMTAACATMFNTEHQHLTFNSTPDTAEIVMNGMVMGKTPWSGQVKRGSEQTITIRKEGFESQVVQLKGEMSGWVVANALWGLAGVLSTTVDISSGAGYAYAPNAYHVTLVSKGTATSAARDTVTDGRLKRFVLMFYPDIVREASLGSGEKFDALREMTGHHDRAAFADLCMRELSDAPGADGFAERMIRARTTGRFARR